MKPCVTYARVSSEEQAKVGYSIPFQTSRIEEYAANNEYEIQARFKEAHSAKDTGRPRFQEMVAFLEDHPDVRVVLVHKLDRISRNLTDYSLLTERLGVWVLPVDEPMEETPTTTLMQLVGMGMARHYSMNLSREVKKGLQAKFEAGGFVTRAPVGYRNIPRTSKEKGKVVVDPEKALVVRRAFERYATGEISFAELADEMFDHGLRTRTGKPYPKERIRQMLKDPFYKGLTRYQGEIRPGNHEALVSDELWHQVQQVLSRRSRDTGEKGSRFFLLRGLLFCGSCGRRMTAESHPRGSYYRCFTDPRHAKCAEPYVPVNELDQAVELLLPAITLTSDVRKKVRVALYQLEQERQQLRRTEERKLATKQAQLESKLTRLTEGFTEGVVPKDQYEKLSTTFQRELAVTQERLEFLSVDLSDDLERIESFLEMASSIADFYALTKTPEDRKDLLHQVFARIEITGRKITHIEYHPPFDLLLGEKPESGSVDSVSRALLEHMADRRGCGEQAT